MAVREVIQYLDHKVALRQKSKAVARVNQKTYRLIHDLKETLEADSGGIGLAAPQINVPKRIVVVTLRVPRGPRGSEVSLQATQAGSQRPRQFV